MTRLWKNKVYNDTSLNHYHNKEEGKDQISIQSSSTPKTEHIMGK